MRSKLVKMMTRFSSLITPGHIAMTAAGQQFRLKCMEHVLNSPGSVVADVAGGKTWHLPAALKEATGVTLVGLDIDAAELAENNMIDHKIVADACDRIPTDFGKYSVITVRAGIEHFHDNARFLLNAFGALEPGGVLIALFPNKFAPFALINQALPHKLSKFLLQKLTRGGEEGVLGFRAHYDRTSYRSFSKIARDAGFEIEFCYPSFFSSAYFRAIPPIYIISLLFDYLRFFLGIRSLASYYCFVLRSSA